MFEKEKIDTIIDLDLGYYEIHENGKIIYLDAFLSREQLQQLVDSF
jgi:hypothetical protein